jgi:hypothetical protein
MPQFISVTCPPLALVVGGGGATLPSRLDLLPTHNERRYKVTARNSALYLEEYSSATESNS